MSKDDERSRIRAKLSEQDREFMAALQTMIPRDTLVGIKFKDGETIGRTK